MSTDDFSDFLGRTYQQVSTDIINKATSAGYSICCILESAEHTDSDDMRLNVWVDQLLTIKKFTIG